MAQYLSGTCSRPTVLMDETTQILGSGRPWLHRMVMRGHVKRGSNHSRRCSDGEKNVFLCD